jgi:hypothetical protein
MSNDSWFALEALLMILILFCCWRCKQLLAAATSALAKIHVLLSELAGPELERQERLRRLDARYESMVGPEQYRKERQGL